MHNHKTICLNMIVKNEAHVIVSTLENLCDYIQFDYWVIVDTGSTDNTKELICDFFRDKNIKGELHETEWKNFGFNRSDALSKAYNKTDYLLIFDADDRIVGDFVLPVELNKDGYHLKFGDNFSYVRLLFVNNRLTWKFMGVLHEYITCINENYNCTFSNVDGNYHLVSGKSGARSNNPNKYKDDAMILEKAYDEAQKNNDEIMVRYSFYCAQSYKDAGNNEKAIEWYKKRISHGGWNQEVYYSYTTIGNLYAQMNNMESALYYWALSFDADPERCEGIYYIVKHCREKGKFQLGLQYYKWVEKNKTRTLLDKLFVTEDIYKYLLDYEFTIIASYINRHSEAISSFHTLFKYANALNTGLKENIISNLNFYLNFIDCSVENLPFFYDYIAFVKQIYLETGCLKKYIVDITNKMKDKFIPLLTQYDNSKVDSLQNLNLENGGHDIILTITSCKRFELFEKTINSFINNCKDINKVTYFFCVDDNSSQEDRERMMKMYPFFHFYFKNIEEKGHRQSMNIIWNKLNELKPKFYLHLEDDWLFINKCNYIKESISFLERFECEKIHQILFNKNYAEVINDYNLVGGKIIDKNNKFKLHIKDEAILSGLNCAYWPHFSFRPSVIRTSAVLALGNFDSPNTFFERDYADKYFNAGYMSAFFNEVNSIHIGKLSYKSQTDKKNAYELNGEEQFVNTGNTNVIKSRNAVNIIKVINLLRRPDRKESVIRNFKNTNITNYEFIEAVDGNALIPTFEIVTLFKGNDFGNRRGVIGCALTHYNLWKKLMESDVEYFLIMEDDFTIVESFKEEIEKIDFEKYDILLMGYHMFSKTLEKVKSIYYNNDSVTIEKLQMDYYIGGIHCYSINKNGARKLLNYIDKNGIKHGIDYLFKIIPELECFETRPHISFAEWNEDGKAIDSDIQNLYDGIDLSHTLDKLLEKYDCYSNQDFFGSDICHIGNKSLFDQLLIAESNSNCICFNTLGYFKREVNTNQLKTLNRCNLYVKKHTNNINNNEKVDNDDGYVFIQGLDQKDCDLYRKNNMSVEEMKAEADKTPNCVCFNTLGFFKNNIYHLVTSPYFSNKDGLYVKKEHYFLHNSNINHYRELYPLEKYKKNERIIRVKMLCNWCSSKDLCNAWSNMCESGYRWKNIEITWNDDSNIDYWVIINKPCDNSYYDPKRTIVFQMEPWVHNESFLWGVKTWEKWATPTNFMEVRGRKQKCHNNAFWQLELNLSEILNLKVENRVDVVSSMCSSKYFDEGHIARIDFLKFLEQKGDVELDIYNWDNQHNFKNFRGPRNQYVDKSKGYIPYKYYFMVENNYEENFITEKIWEPILCETLVFYYGCPNVCDYIDAEAFVQLDMHDFEKSYQIIKQAIEEDWWSMRIEAIRREKNKILNELAFFPVIENIINKSDYVNVKLQTIHSNLQIKHGSLNDEVPEQKMSVKYLTGNEKVLEIGGNIGRNSLVIAYILKNNSDFVTLECDLNIANQLIENRDLNHFTFHVENSALSKRKLIQKNWDTMPSDTLQEGYNWVNTITLDELKCKYKINFDTLVLDCEGAFYYILMDMPEILDSIKLIIMENDYHEKSKKEFVDKILLKNNFYVAHQEAGGWGPCYHNFFEVWKKYIF
jgi:GR25 family glycosyltransferase involved in LPS biosynthesis